MEDVKIQQAMKEASKFVARAHTLLKGGILSGTQESSALRRQSMELTRALAEMRRP